MTINRCPLRVFLLLAATASCALADPLTFTFTSSLLNAGRGQTVTFGATLTNVGPPVVFLNSDTVNVAAPLVADDIKFFLNFPASLSAGQSVTAPILDVFVPLSAPFGIYSGNFTILGGGDPGALNTLASANFAVNVVPEPGTFTALLAGTCWLMLRYRRRR
jgi:hypothetical protein